MHYSHDPVQHGRWRSDSPLPPLFNPPLASEILCPSESRRNGWFRTLYSKSKEERKGWE